MAATKVGIVYSVALRALRWMVLPDSDAELPMKTRPGEAYVEQAMADYHQRGPDAAVQDATGGPPLSCRCAVIDQSSTVTDHVMGDPAIDTIAGTSLVLSDISIQGDVFQAGAFMRRFALADATGLVQQIVTADAKTPPISPLGGSVQPSQTLQIGNLVPVKVSGSIG